jgi:UDP-MurNAc hydroxylase
VKFTIISHACMLVEHARTRLITDPWLSGSAYWRSWWHFPEAHPLDVASVDYVYLTHQHFDHFHYPSMRRFRRDVTVLVPHFPTPGMEEAVAALGFSNVVSLEHDETLVLPSGLRITSYQAGLGTNDSALILQAGDTTLMNLNDVKLPTPLLAQLARRYGPVTFMLRSHSSAQAYPECYSSPRADDLALRSRGHYVRDFINAATVTRARYAVPFASNVCFLHPDTFATNSDSVDPRQVALAHGDRIHPEVVVMLPGSSWSRASGFQLSSTEVLSRRDSELVRLRDAMQDKLDQQHGEEAAKPLQWETFAAYMRGFLRSVPWLASLAYRARVAFAAPDGEYWVLDFGRRDVERHKARPINVVSVITVAPGLLQDALEKSIVNFIDISKRLRIELTAGKTLDHFVFRQLLTMYEEGFLPLHKSLRPRFFSVWLRRWRELFATAAAVLVRGRRAFIPEVEGRTPG